MGGRESVEVQEGEEGEAKSESVPDARAPRRCLSARAPAVSRWRLGPLTSLRVLQRELVRQPVEISSPVEGKREEAKDWRRRRRGADRAGEEAADWGRERMGMGRGSGDGIGC